MIYVHTNAIDMYAKYQINAHVVSEKIFEYLFRTFTLYVALATNHVKRFGQKSHET